MASVWDKVKSAVKHKAIPLDVVVELTRRCNLRCCHCYNIKDESMLSFDQVKTVSAQLRDAGTLFVTLTGGEVFTHPEIFDICFYLKENGFDLKVFTNGTLINETNIAKIKELYFSEVGISVHGAFAQTHDLITGCPGSFELSINAVRLLKENNIPVSIKTTLMKDNFDEFKALINMAEELGVSYVMDPVVSPKDDGTKKVLDNRVSCQQLDRFFEHELRLKGLALEDFDEFQCPAGTVMAGISAKGDVYPCIQLPEKLGNVFSGSFKKIWHESCFLEKLRNPGRIEECVDCKLIEYCNRCPGLAYLEDGDAFGKSTAACNNAESHKRIMSK